MNYTSITATAQGIVTYLDGKSEFVKYDKLAQNKISTNKRVQKTQDSLYLNLIQRSMYRRLMYGLKEYTPEQIEFFEDKVKKMPPQDYITRMKETNKIDSERSDALLVFPDGTQSKYNTLDVWKNRWHTFYGWECNLGVDRVTIQADGSITGACTARYIFNQDTPFSVLDPEFTTKFTPSVIAPIICKEVFCSGCSSDIRLTKRKLNV